MNLLGSLCINIYFKWILLVGLNSITGFVLGFESGDYVGLSGMILGVFTWYLLYLNLDLYLQKTGREKLSHRLLLCAVLRIPVQLMVVPDMYSGIAAIMTVKYLGLTGSSNSFIAAYFSTLFTGLYLSVICSIIFAIITVVDKVRAVK
ncbi:MAG: hypothetical protein OFPII_17940 [Osedax symbiont Rs1]|nr:MAG: hypothetical protein OFPII_17940 [Osedax symbiont Rs1]